MSLRRKVARLLAIVLTVLLVATACGSDADSTTSGGVFADSSSSDTSNDSSFDRGSDDRGDAESVFTDDAMVDDTNDSAAATTRPSTDGDAAFAGRDEDAAETEADDGVGLFGTVEVAPEDEEVPSRTQDSDGRFTDYGIRRFIDADDDPFSTFALDVDTGSYSIARGYLLDEGELPPRASVRVEEYVNAHTYDYRAPRRGLDLEVDGGPSPFDEDAFLVRIGVQAVEIEDDERVPVSLTFVVDTSGSMSANDRLPLVRRSLEVLVDELDRGDTVAIVTYSGSSGIILEPTDVRYRDDIIDAIRSMDSGGSTNLQAGLDTGYDLARESFIDDGVNRVIVASDGLANAGITDVDRLADRIRRDADEGIGIVTVGYGLRGINDTTMEQLADQGDGFYSYVDTIDEAKRLFRDELTSTLITAAIDAKIQVEFDPDVVEDYRLLGYENRGVLDRDFRNDDVDAGELGAGHQATALYEITLARGVDIDDRDEIGVVMLRWEDPETGDVTEIDEDIDLRDVEPTWSRTDEDFQHAVVVATFAEKLRDNPFADEVDLDELLEEVERLDDEIDTDEFDEFVDMVRIAAGRR
ncbi:MAG: DUF3520 domain-containing protein [Acidimicrobiales bacterium]|nr:DUF3520 domain-containing protein [Acidimicrobiales bacterium]